MLMLSGANPNVKSFRRYTAFQYASYHRDEDSSDAKRDQENTEDKNIESVRDLVMRSIFEISKSSAVSVGSNINIAHKRIFIFEPG